MDERCQIPRCRDEVAVVYLGHGICGPHWNQLMNDNAPPDALRMALGIEAEPELMETDMSKKKAKKNGKAKQAAVERETPTETEQVDATGAAEAADADETSSQQEAPETAASGTTATKGDKKAKAPKEPKPARAPKEDGLVVFAFRLRPEERDTIHKAAGPARASRFVRTIAVAAAQDDEAAIRTAIKDAREVSQ